MPSPSILETPRLRLRPFVPDDAPFILELLNEPAFIQNIADKGVRDVNGARAYLVNGPMASYQRQGFGLWAVERKESSESIGMCGLIKRDGLEDVDLGFAFLERHWSRGYAAEAALATLRYGLEILHLERVVAITAPDNAGSIKVLERIGLRLEKTIHLPNFGGDNLLFVSDPCCWRTATTECSTEEKLV